MIFGEAVNGSDNVHHRVNARPADFLAALFAARALSLETVLIEVKLLGVV